MRTVATRAGTTRETSSRDDAARSAPQPNVCVVAELDTAGQAALGNQYTEQANQPGLCVQRSADGSCSGCCGACQSGEERADGIQASLEVGSPGDPHELEADRIADQVVQRAADEGAEAEGDANGQAADQAGTQPDTNPILPQIQQLLAEDGVGLKSAGTTDPCTAGIAATLDSTLGSGQPLPGTVQREMEGAFGVDFGAVRLHTDARAAQMSRQLAAHAFTRGDDIYFGAGKFDPATSSGKHLLAHELTHTLQQRGGRGGPIRRLSVTRNSRTPGTCGGHEVKWTFTLDNPAPTDGYIVQRVRQLQTVERCPSNVSSISLTPDPPEYWEAWLVRAGSTREVLHSSFGYTDMCRRPDAPNTSGTAAQLGTIKFFPVATTGDLGRDGVPPSTPGSSWGPGRAPMSGDLPSTTTQPTWWNGAAGEGPARRWASAWWNCCPAGPARNEIDSSP